MVASHQKHTVYMVIFESYISRKPSLKDFRGLICAGHHVEYIVS